MFDTIKKQLSVLFVTMLLVVFALQPAAAQTTGDVLFAVDVNNNLVSFLSTDPSDLLGRFPITGIGSDTIVGIDFRPANSSLYAVGVSGGTGRIYIIDTFSGAATRVGGAAGFALNGGAFAMDFNPTVDRVRFVSDSEQNLRLNQLTGAIAATDGTITPAGNIVGAAYTGNFGGSTRTTLYVIDSANDTLALQGGVNGSPTPNNGGITTVGNLGVDTSDLVGFDISSGGAAYASLTVGGVSGLYSIDLRTGAASSLGSIGGSSVRGLALGTARLIATPTAPLCSNVNGATSAIVRATIPATTVTGGNSVFCRPIVENGAFVESPATIGVQSVLNLRILQAVDIFTAPGNITFANAIRVCLLGVGDFIFLDAAGSPRTPALLFSSSEGAYTCADVPNAGTVLLTNPTGSAAAGETALTSCTVITTGEVNLRTGPSTDNDRITIVPPNTSLNAAASTSGWFRVNFNGSDGWINASFVTTSGTCG